MFINCPYCKALVSTDPVTDLPPPHCPHCDSLLRRDPEAADDEAEVAPLDLGTLLDARAIAEAAAEAEANAARRSSEGRSNGHRVDPRIGADRRGPAGTDARRPRG